VAEPASDDHLRRRIVGLSPEDLARLADGLGVGVSTGNGPSGPPPVAAAAPAPSPVPTAVDAPAEQPGAPGLPGLPGDLDGLGERELDAILSVLIEESGGGGGGGGGRPAGEHRAPEHPAPVPAPAAAPEPAGVGPAGARLPTLEGAIDALAGSVRRTGGWHAFAAALGPVLARAAGERLSPDAVARLGNLLLVAGALGGAGSPGSRS
jgi:hypothetical protein